MNVFKPMLMAGAVLVFATAAMALEPGPSLRLGWVRSSSGGCRLKVHGAPARTLVQLKVLDENGKALPEAPPAYECETDTFGRIDVSLIKILTDLHINVSDEYLPRAVQFTAILSSYANPVSNPVLITLFPSAYVIASTGEDGKGIVQWFDARTWQEVGKPIEVNGRPDRIVYTPDRLRFFVLTDAARGTVLCFDSSGQPLKEFDKGELGLNVTDLLVTSDGLRLLVLSRGRVDEGQRASRGRLSIVDLGSLQVQEPGVPVVITRDAPARIVEDDEAPWRVFVMQANMQVAQINLFQRYCEEIFEVDPVADDVVREEMRDMVVANRTMFVATAGRTSTGNQVGALSWLEKGTRDHGRLTLPGVPLRVLAGAGPEGKSAIFLLFDHELLVIDAATKSELGRLPVAPGAYQMLPVEERHMSLILFHASPGSESSVRAINTLTLETLSIDDSEQPPLGLSDPSGMTPISWPRPAVAFLLADQNEARILDLDTMTLQTIMLGSSRPLTITGR